MPEQCLIPLPDDVPSRLAPLLLDTIGTAAMGCGSCGTAFQEGPTLVVGAGALPIGLGAVIAAQGGSALGP